MARGVIRSPRRLYLKQVEGRVRNGQPIRPKTVSARTHAVTRLPGFQDAGHIRSSYYDIEDMSMMHVEFDDGTLADIFASDIVLGGIHNWLEVCANNHRTLCQINPNTAMMTYNPREEYFKDIYVVEKIGTKQGWACTSPDEDWMTGYLQETEAFYRAIAYGEPVESDILLAANAISTIYSATSRLSVRGLRSRCGRTDETRLSRQKTVFPSVEPIPVGLYCQQIDVGWPCWAWPRRLRAANHRLLRSLSMRRYAILSALVMLAALVYVGRVSGQEITTSDWGLIDGKPVKLYTLKNVSGLILKVTNYGAIITQLHVPDRNGKLADVVLGFDSLDGYIAGHPYFGSLVGRSANRIAKGRFSLDGQSYQLAAQRLPQSPPWRRQGV